MNIGFVGLGKLGLPVALAIEQCGHSVTGCDLSDEVASAVKSRTFRYQEHGAQEALAKSNLVILSLAEVLVVSDLIFIAVQTPHEPAYEGVTPVPPERKDFDYTFLEAAFRSVAEELSRLKIPRTIVIISTVLPGTVRARLKPLCNPFVKLCYNPFFIAMGTVMEDFLRPEFVLLGEEDKLAGDKVRAFYCTIHSAPIFTTTVENAELIKVLYNTFISMKLAFANTAMELCHKLPGTDCDAVVRALSLASKRIISPSYLSGGMGDGGACHPRDNIALSWLAEKLSLSHDLFSDIVKAREDQTRWLAQLLQKARDDLQLPLVLLGRAFKADSNIDTGSPARLLSHCLTDLDVQHKIYDPFIKGFDQYPRSEPSIYFIAACHEAWHSFEFCAGSTVIDPWRVYREQAQRCQCNYLPIGLGPSA